MRFFVTILLIVPLFCFSQSNAMFRAVGGSKSVIASVFTPDSILWNFSATTATISGARNVSGNPFAGVQTDNAPNGWTLSSVSTSNWIPYTVTNSCAINGITGAGTANACFPELANTALANAWFMLGDNVDPYDPSKPQIIISGLTPGQNYYVKMSGCDGSLGFDANPMNYRVQGSGAVQGPQSVNGDTGAGTQTAFAAFTVAADGSGQIKIWVGNTVDSDVALIAVLKVAKRP